MGSELGRLWLAAAALVAGAALGDWRARGPWIAVVILSLVLLARRTRLLGALGLVGLCLAAGWFSAAQREMRPAPLEALASHAPRCDLTGRILEGGGGLGTTAAVEEARCRGYASLEKAGVVVFDGTAAAGSLFRGRGYLVPLRDDPFDRARRRLGADASFEAVDLTFSPPPPGPFRLAASLRAGLRRAGRGLGPRGSGLLRGLALGDTTGLDPATEELFRRAGLSHLLAVSGSNVAIVLGAVGLLATGLPLRLRVVAGGGALALFVLVVGPEPSVLRAAAMGAVALLALALGRTVEPFHGLALAVIAVVGARPGMVFSVGLHLSVAATAGLILFSAPIAQRIRLPRPVALGLGATLAAQFAVAPVVVATFGELSLVSPLANLLAVPAVPPATVLGVAGAVAGAVDPPLGAVVVAGARPFLSWILFCGDRFGSLRWASIELARTWAWPLAGAAVCAAMMTLRRGSAPAG